MLKKISVLLLAILFVANCSFGQWVYWGNGAGDRDWANNANWTAVPTSGDDVLVGMDSANGPILGSGDTGAANWLHIADTQATAAKLTIDGGTLNVADHTLIGEWATDQKGIIEINSGTMNTTLLMCGGATNGSVGDGTVLMNGGNLNISWLLAVAGGYNGDDGAGVGHIQLDGGVINVTGGGSLVMSNNGSIDITGGSLILLGDITDITTFGNVTAYNGTGSFAYSFDGSATTITAAIPEPATLAVIGLGFLFVRRKRA